MDTLPLDALDYLLAVDDVSRIGALRLVDEHGVFQRTVGDAERRTPPLVELGQLLSASRAVETDSETGADLAYLLGRATSLGGLRPKCSVLDEDGSLEIGKFPTVGDTRSVVHGEVLALRLARDAGIDAAPVRLVDADGTAVALVRRFDRTPGGERLMYASAATMLGAEPGGDEHCYTEIVDALRRHGTGSCGAIASVPWSRPIEASRAFDVATTEGQGLSCGSSKLVTNRHSARLSSNSPFDR